MKKSTLASKANSLQVEELDVTRYHNGLWEQGDRLAEIMVEVVNTLA
jgi:hypothetical protein